MPEVTVIDIQKFLTHGSTTPVALREMQEFWKACSDTEKAAFKASVANWDKKSFFC